MTLTWAELSQNADQNDAFAKISAFIKSIKIENFSYAEISQVMLAGAFTVVDYEDPRDALMNFNYKDGRARQIRLSNFMDFASEFTQRRTSQSQDDDRYMAQALHDFERAEDETCKADIIGNDFEDLVQAVDELSAELLSEGHQRLSLAKAYLDAAFIAAMKDGEHYYNDFAQQVINSLDPESDKLQKKFAGEKDVVEALGFAISSGSTTIH